jgi:hypothetical protein
VHPQTRGAWCCDACYSKVMAKIELDRNWYIVEYLGIEVRVYSNREFINMLNKDFFKLEVNNAE